MPPRLAVALVRRAVPADAAGRSVLGDLLEEFADRARRSSLLRARLWYWRQALSLWWWSAWAHPLDSFHQPLGGAMFDAVGDLRSAWRSARRSIGQTLLVIATLALAIGATTIGFSLADTILLRGLPVADPEDTVIVYAIDPRQPDRRAGVFFDDYIQLRARSRSLERLATWSHRSSTVVHDGGAYAAQVARVAGDLFGAWEIDARLGRVLRPGDDDPGAAPVAVLASHYWERIFGASPAIIGDTILIDGAAHEVVGVVEAAIEFGTFANVAIWASRPLTPAAARDADTGIVTGRLAPGMTVAQASAELTTIAGGLAAEHPDTNRGRTLLVLPANRAIGGPNFWIVMTLLLSAVALVMIVASANVAGILLARAAAREREFALRVALGAGRGRLFRQLVLEGLLMALAAGAGALVAAEAGLRLIRAADAEPIFQQLAIDAHEVLFVAALALFTPLVFSLAPALASARTDLVAALNAGTMRSIGSAGRARAVLVVAQLAFAVALVTVGGLVARTATALAAAPLGFETGGLVSFTLVLDDAQDASERRRQVRALSDALVTPALAAGALDTLPGIAVEPVAAVEIPGQQRVSGESEPWAHVIAVDDLALPALGVALVAGRSLDAQDTASDGVALVSAEFARRHFGAVDAALGRHVRVRQGGNARTRQIVGVTSDTRGAEPERGMLPRIWVPLSAPRQVSIVVRAPGDLAGAAERIRRVVGERLPGVPVRALESYEQSVARRGGSDRVVMGMFLGFTAVALLFASTGLYGVVAVAANLRRSEFATRYALGAQTRDVARLVVGQAFRLLIPGLAIGLAGGLLLAQAMRGMFYGVAPLDLLNVGGVVGLLALVTVVASLAPAIRAARVDVVDALRG